MTKRRVGARERRWAVGLAVVLAGCREPAAPATLEGDPITLPPTLGRWRASAFTIDVARRTGTVTVSTTRPGNGTGESPELSILAADAINLVATGYASTGVGTGGAPAGKVLVTFDLRITNTLIGPSLIKPTFPLPPNQTSQVYVFPLEAIPTTTSGSAGTNGNDVIVELPNRGGVVPSPDFDGPPHSFFNDQGCPPAANDCFRYEPYLAPIPGLGTSEIRRVGFVVDPTISNFRARLLVAADLSEALPVVRVIVFGIVDSPQLGPLNGVVVRFGGRQTITGSQSTVPGSYAIDLAPRPSGTLLLEASGLPPGCSAASIPVPVTPGGPLTIQVDIVADCSGTLGTAYPVSGRLLGPGSVPVGGAAVSVADRGVSPIVVTTAADGTWVLPAVPAGTRRLRVGLIPPSCQAGRTIDVSGPTSGVDLVLDCNRGSIATSLGFGPGTTATPSLGLAVVRAITAAADTTVWQSAPPAGGLISLGVSLAPGFLSVTQLPPGCVAVPAGAIPYAGLSAGGTISPGGFSVTCLPANYYPVRGEWSQVTATGARLIIWIDMLAFNDPLNNGVGDDRLAAFQFRLLFPENRLVPLACVLPPGFGGVSNLGTPGSLAIVATNPTGSTGSRVELADCRFALLPGGPVRPVLLDLLAGDENGTEFSDRLAGRIDLLP